MFRLGGSAGPQRRSQAAGGASLWAPDLRTADGDGREGAELQRASLLRSLVGRGVFSTAEETTASLPVAPPTVTVQNQRSCPNSRPSRRLWVSQGEDPPLSAPIDRASNRCPCPDVHVSLASPSQGLTWRPSQALSCGDSGSGVEESAFQPGFAPRTPRFSGNVFVVL